MTHPGNSEYVLVPREPTLEMQRAGLDALDGGALGLCDCCHNDVWTAMIAAAPAQPSSWHRIDDPVNPAPKDGSRFLAWVRVEGEEQDEDGYRIGDFEDEYAVVAYYAFGGFVEFPWRGSFVQNMKFKKWRPLPPPPDEGG